jgi:hypothetical protein
MDMLERFKEIYCLNFDEKKKESFYAETTCIRTGTFTHTLGSLAKDKFHLRSVVSGIWTVCLLVFQEKHRHFEMNRMATLDEDQNKGIDAFTSLGPIQYKIRENYEDLICARYQPYHNYEVGRDYKGLTSETDSVNLVITAIWDKDRVSKIHVVNAKKFLSKVQELDSKWNRAHIKLKSKRVYADLGEVHHITQDKENYSKIIFFIPVSNFDKKSRATILLKDSQAQELNDLYKLAYAWVKSKYFVDYTKMF